jgi:hypothetical protein
MVLGTLLIVIFDLEAALLAWNAAKSDLDAALVRHGRLVVRTSSVAHALNMTPRELSLVRSWARDGHYPSSPAGLANLAAYRRSKAAQEWAEQLAEAEAGVALARRRLTATTRQLVKLVGIDDARLLTGQYVQLDRSSTPM